MHNTSALFQALLDTFQVIYTFIHEYAFDILLFELIHNTPAITTICITDIITFIDTCSLLNFSLFNSDFKKSEKICHQIVKVYRFVYL